MGASVFHPEPSDSEPRGIAFLTLDLKILTQGRNTFIPGNPILTSRKCGGPIL
jgi:hypothetical protein